VKNKDSEYLKLSIWVNSINQFLIIHY